MKAFLHSFLLLLCLLCMCPHAALAINDSRVSVSHERGDVCIRFHEPVVSFSVVENSRRGMGSEAERGLDLFTLSGGPPPDVRWVDQHCLRIRFAPGSSVCSTWRLDFRPGVRFLSGREVPPTCEFRPAPVSLQAEMLPTHAGGAALVFACESTMLEAQQLHSRHAGLKVAFRRIEFTKAHEKIERELVPATLRPASVADGTGDNRSIGNLLLAQVKPAGIGPQTLLPQTLLALPESPLRPGELYCVEIADAPELGFAGGVSARRALPKELRVQLQLELAEARGNTIPAKLLFDKPMKEACLRRLWTELAPRVDGQAATLSEDGQCYRATVNGKDVLLRFRGLLPLPERQNARMDEGCYCISLPECAAGLEMELLAEVPMELELTLPEGLRSAHGLATTARSIAQPVYPAWPHWNGTGNLVPLSGSHLLRLPSLNLGEVSVSLHHWEAESAARLLPLICRARRDDSALFELACRKGCLSRKGASPHEGLLLYVEEALAFVRKDRLAQRELRRRIFAEGCAFPAVPLRHEATADAFVSRGEIVLDLDAAAGGADKLRPGLYLVSLQARPSETLCALLAPMLPRVEDAAGGGTDELLCCRVEYLVQVTDIGLEHGRAHLLGNSLANGEPLEGMEARAYEFPRRRAEDEPMAEARPCDCVLPMPQGVAKLAPDMASKLLLVQRGADYRLYTVPVSVVSAEGKQQPDALQLELFCDRPLYRPGDTVHLRGVLRDMRGSEPALPALRQVLLSVHYPNGELLEKRELTVDAYGGVSADVCLPDAEEDVTGGYDFRLEAGEFSAGLRVNCEVFRRDSFKLELSTELAPVAPGELLVKLRAQNYDGTPLRGGRVLLDMRTREPIIRAEKGEVRELEGLALTLNEEGCGEYRVPLAPVSRMGNFYVTASASNEREEYVKTSVMSAQFSPADFRIVWDEGARRIELLDARSGAPLAREQALSLVVSVGRERWEKLGPALSRLSEERVELLRRDVLVPAAGAGEPGLAVGELLDALREEDSWVRLEISGLDGEGRRATAGSWLSLRRSQGLPMGFEAKLSGDAIHVVPEEKWEGARVHALVSSQGRLRPVLAELAADGSLTVPLQADEYGELRLILVRCAVGQNGADASWYVAGRSLERPRPDKLLQVALTVPQGAGPGDACCISGCVKDAGGRPCRAGVTLFAVDEGMLSVAPYHLPELAECFYQGEAPWFELDWRRRKELGLPLVRSLLHGLPGLPNAGQRGLWADCENWGRFSGVGLSAQENAFELIRMAAAGHGEAMFPSVEIGGGLGEGGAGLGAASTAGARPRLRQNFRPVALWQGCVETAEDGSFRCPLTLPDTLTSYRVFALALGADGSTFGSATSEFLVNQELMLAAGTPFFMSVGDSLRLPLTITNNSEEAGSWKVSFNGAGEPAAQSVQLAPHESRTLYFELTTPQEGDCVLSWTADGDRSGDAVEARFPVLYPAPLLREHHRCVLRPGKELDAAQLLAPELVSSTRGSLVLEYSTSPLLHLSGCLDYLLTYPHGCTEQTASALLPWLYHRHLAPFCPQMARRSEAEVQETVRRSTAALLARQQEDGGLSYWGSTPGESHDSCAWASAYAALVLTLAEEQGYELPQQPMERLRAYLRTLDWKDSGLLLRYAAARACGENKRAAALLARACEEGGSGPLAVDADQLATLRFMESVARKPAARHEALLRWMRSRGHDYRHRSTWRSGWQLIALGEYLKHEPRSSAPARLLVNGESKEVTAAPARMEWKADGTVAQAMPRLRSKDGQVYLTVKVRALPERTDYPGVTEKGLQVTRIYETQGADGLWRASTNWKVGEVVRVTLTCAKAEEELEYFVLEDKLPSCLEVINPRVPGQAVGIENGGWGSWSPCIDHKEYLADRVRAFSTRWWGRELINMRYYARVKRAGEAVSPPAEAQLMYEPQTYGLSPNTRVRVEP